jgi:protein O-GlcNAc transferase
MTPELKKILQEIMQYFREGDFEKAELSIRRALKDEYQNSLPILELAIAYAKVNQFKEALIALVCLKQFKKDDLIVLYNLGLIHSAIGNHQQAIENYNEILAINPGDVETLVNKGSSLIDLQSYELAISTLQSAINIRSDIPEAWSNLGKAYNSLNLCQESLDAYDKALSLRPSFYEAWSNKSRPLSKLRRFVEASDACDKALLLHPEYVEGLSNKGNALYELERFEDAIDFFDEALRLRPSYAEAFLNKGHALFQLGRYVEAISSYEEALVLNPDIDWLHGCLIFAKMKICDWTGMDGYIEKITGKVILGHKVIDPLALLSLVDDSFIHKKAAEILIQTRHPLNTALGDIPKHPKNEKIRIGYFSADFKNHPVAFLIAELFEIHDRNQFEVYAFSLVSTKDKMRDRIVSSVDHFIDVEKKSDLEIAELSRSLSVDIAINLSGFTQDSRTGLFAYRAAPIQVNYLGYPGTTGSNYFDYIIADRTLIPTQSQGFYSEKVVYLPNSFQVNDRKRSISTKQFTKHELGLPTNGFIFCCFNNSYKILPVTFDGWMRILKAVDESVLWLFEDNPSATENLRLEASRRGVDPNRLIFAQKLPLEEHLARHYLADLFLDTMPYNAHTTASDALWTNLPVLTLMGESFASRGAASLLNAIGIPELIAHTQIEYEEMAILLAKNPEKLHAIKQKLSDNRLVKPLFDTPLYSRGIETAFMEMYRRYQADLLPDHLFIT